MIKSLGPREGRRLSHAPVVSNGYTPLDIKLSVCCGVYMFQFTFFAEQVAVYFVGLIPSNFYHVLPAKDWAGFWSTLSESIMYIVLVASVSNQFSLNYSVADSWTKA